jgi:hypothetical protein
MTFEEYTPTEGEAEAIDRAGLEAAWHELQPMKDDDLPTPKKVLACLRAFKAARAAANDAIKALEAAHKEASYVSHFPETTDMVCSALMGLDLDSPDEIHPRSIIGARLSALFQAAKALEAMSTVYSAFDDDDGIFGTYLAEETTALAEASILGGLEANK